MFLLTTAIIVSSFRGYWRSVCTWSATHTSKQYYFAQKRHT